MFSKFDISPYLFVLLNILNEKPAGIKPRQKYIFDDVFYAFFLKF